MSHFTEVKTKIKNREILKKALSKLGHTIIDNPQGNGVEVRGYFGETQAAEFKILTATHYDIGFKRSADGAYEVVGDWELLPKVSGVDQDQFTKQLKKEYAHQMILHIAQDLGYSIDYLKTESQSEEGGMELSIKQWGAQ